MTGGAGFIGSHLADALLARGDEVHVVDNLVSGSRENVAAGAAARCSTFASRWKGSSHELRPEAVFHLAAQADVRVSVERPDYDAAVNVVGTIRVLEAARAPVRRSSSPRPAARSTASASGPRRRATSAAPLAPYGAAKLAAEEYLGHLPAPLRHEPRRAALRQRLRPAPGPARRGGRRRDLLRADAHGRAAAASSATASQTRDYVYVGDVVAACLAAIGAGGGVFNVGTGRETSVVELCEACRRVAGSDAEAVLAPARLGELQRSVLDPSLAAGALGWAPRTSLDEGLALTWDWARSRKS